MHGFQTNKQVEKVLREPRMCSYKVCNLCKRDLFSLDFVVNRFLMKLFRTSDISVITYCREMFQFDLPSAILKKLAEKFDSVSFN